VSAVPSSARVLGRGYPVAAAVLVSVSGLLMLGVGDALAQQDWTRARPLALAGGVAVQFALAIERRGVRLRRTPSAKGGRSFVVQIAASGLVLLAGAGLVGIGAISKRHGWRPIGVAAVIPLLAVLGAAILNRRAAAIRLAKAARAQPGRARLGTRWQKLRGGKPHV
jgi:hypothetical protein